MPKMKYFQLSQVCFGVVFLTFCIISKVIFDRMYLTSQMIIDEEFHLPLGKAYCEYDFSRWHPKVTTFPGLYLLSSLLLGGLNLCTVYWLRFVSLLSSFVNFYLFYELLSINSDDPKWKIILSALNLALLPPLFLFGHLYYTDVASLTMILLMLVSSKKNHHFLASCFGLLAVLFRQTNIIWVAMIFADYVLRELNALHLKKPTKQDVSAQELGQLLKALRSQFFVILHRTTLSFWLNCLCYGALFISFAIFILLNGSIVVGDKTAHEATIHLPQLFYFSLFTLVFGWPHFMLEGVNFLKFTKSHKMLCLLTVGLFLVVVHFNTVVHPYVLADNRHYVFYIWNRFYGRYYLFRYLIVPAYLFAFYVIFKHLLNKKSITFLVTFVPCAIAVLITPKLLEFRYFLIPYVLFRLHLRNVFSHCLWGELVSYCVLNAIVLYLFFTKPIQWNDYENPQRLIW